MLGERPLSSLARELLERERDQREDDALKVRAMQRARAFVQRDRPSGVDFKSAGLAALPARRSRLLRTLPLIAAAIAVAGLAAAGAGFYAEKSVKDVPQLGLTKLMLPRARHVAVGGGLVGTSSPHDAALDRPPVQPRAPGTSTAGSESTRAPSVKQYATELALLEPARSSIGHGNYGAALAAIDQHRREFPNGQLSEEREALRVRALWGLGQRPAALAAAKVFRRRYPRSGLLSWLKGQSEQSDQTQ
jgi:hypothetical protein